jgi:lipopolysaccharide/colanic/teichoic acid biosynthesis glycosyltransferase
MLAQAHGFVFLAHAALTYVGAELAVSPVHLLAGTAISLPLLFVWRLLYSGVLWGSLPTDRVLLIGYPGAIAEIVDSIQARPALGITLLGYVGQPPDGPVDTRLKYLGPMDRFEQLASSLQATTVVVDGSELRIPGLQACLFSLHLRRIRVERFGEFYERILLRVCTSELRPSAVIFDRTLEGKPRSLALQSVYTNLIALCAAIVFSPVMLLIALAIRISGAGAALDGEPHLGLNGIPFRLYRFRCRAKNDELTRLGGWLQRRGLHSLPQLLNVLRGEMSLIGPRAVRSEFAAVIAKALPYEPQRRTVRPGILAWSALFCRDDVWPVEELLRVEYDLYYIKHISLALDLYILLAAARGLVSGSNPAA